MGLLVVGVLVIGLAFLSRITRYVLLGLFVVATVGIGSGWYQWQKAKCDLPQLSGYGEDVNCRAFR